MDIKEALTFDGLKYFYTQYIKPLKTGAFATVVNNATTTVENTVLDGRMGKTLADKDANLQNQIDALNSSLTLEKKQLFMNYFGKYATICKYGQIKSLMYWNEFATPLEKNINYSLTTVPSTYRPVISISKYIEIVADGSYETYPGTITIMETGEILLRPLFKDTQKCSCSFYFTWI